MSFITTPPHFFYFCYRSHPHIRLYVSMFLLVWCLCVTISGWCTFTFAFWPWDCQWVDFLVSLLNAWVWKAWVIVLYQDCLFGAEFKPLSFIYILSRYLEQDVTFNRLFICSFLAWEEVPLESGYNTHVNCKCKL